MFRGSYILAPNYPAGKDALRGFQRFYDGPLAGETYTKLGQKDYAAETAALRGANPDAVFALADRVTVLVSGRAVATGEPHVIRADPVVREAYLGEDA